MLDEDLAREPSSSNNGRLNAPASSNPLPASVTSDSEGDNSATAGFSGEGFSSMMFSESIMNTMMNTDFKCNIGSELFLSSCSAALRNRRDGKNAPKCELDAQGCLSLGNILDSFSAAINEEHAWAICFQFAKTGQSVLSDPECRKLCNLVSKTDHVQIHRDGYVHEQTFVPVPSNPDRPTGKGPPRIKCTCECRLISKLAVVIFTALDHGLQDEEERHLSPDLVALLDAMAAADENGERPETDDEGIERDSGDSDDDRMGNRAFNFDSILELCRSRLVSSVLTTIGNASGSNNGEKGYAAADAHYKAVCRALVAEALELSTFLEKVSQGTQQLKISSSSRSSAGNSSSISDPNSDLDKLHIHDWARLWVQVIRELRNGVKLKKVDSSCRSAPIEYEMTPYEILMDDIRSRRYKLNKVMVDGSLPPRVKKDAHAIILEFIRSRPPLKSVTDRVLPPPPKRKADPIEALMESIRQEHHLRPTKTNTEANSSSSSRRLDSLRNRGRRSSSGDMTENSRVNNNFLRDPTANSNSSLANTNSDIKNGGMTHLKTLSSSPPQMEQPSQPQRRLIKADLDLLYSLDTRDYDDDDEEDAEESYNKSNGGMCFYRHICSSDGTQSTPVSPWKSKPSLGEQNMGGGSAERLVDLRRRHTICNPTMRDDHGATIITFPFEYTNTKKNFFDSLNGPAVSPILHRRKQQLPHSVSKSSLQEEFFQSNHWQTAMECLSLNLEEVVHIRFVLTKAELEALPVDCSLKEDVEKGKICFLCLKTRFGLFGPWGNQCKLCKRTVCAKCCSKMRIPTEHFSKVPVSSLSPALSPRDEEKELLPTSRTPTPNSSSGTNLNKPMGRKNSVGSAPTSPNMSRKSTDSDSGQRSISPGLLDEERDRFSPDQGHGPYSLPTVTSISLGLMAFKRRSFGRGKEDDKTEKLKGSLMVVCHDCKAMVLQIIRSSRAKKASNYRNQLALERSAVQPVA